LASGRGKIRRQLSAAGCALKVLHPLEHGLEKAKKLLETNKGMIDQVEIYNMQDSIHRDPDEILQFCRYVNELNRQDQREGIGPFVPVCGSDATGRSPEIPGMGLLGLDAILGRDYAVFMGTLSVTSMLGLIGNLLSDFCYVLIDPRINFQKQ
jgi:hypothetical protein